MKIRKRQLFLPVIAGIAVVCVIGSRFPFGHEIIADMKTALTEIDHGFTYERKPIHPDLIKEFQIWLSDNCPPVTVSVDVAAAARARNEYDDDRVTVDGSRVRAVSGDPEDHGYYEYEHLGMLRSGAHVIKTYDCGGGSGVFTSLFLVKFTTDRAYRRNGSRYERLLMTVVREYPLSNTGGEIRIDGDRVIIGSSE